MQTVQRFSIEAFPCPGALVQSMKKRRQTKLIPEGKYAAEVVLNFSITTPDWSPYLTVEDAKKLDVRKALRCNDVDCASQLARIYQLTPVSVLR